MTDSLRIALAQLNPTVGDIAGNLARARTARARAADLAADLVILSELFITGYPPEDLILKPAFQEAAAAAVADLAGDTADDGPALLLGTPWRKTAISTTPPCCSMAARSRRGATNAICPTTACSMKSACSPPGRCRAGQLPRRAARRDGVRGTWGGGRVPAETGRDTVIGNARRDRQRDERMNPGDRPRGRDRIAADLRQPVRRPGRAGVRRRLVRARSRPHAQRSGALVVRGSPHHRLAPQQRRAVEMREPAGGRAARAARFHLPGDGGGACATM